MSDIEVTIDAATFRQAGSTALEILEMTRQASHTGVLDREVVDTTDSMMVAMGTVFLMEAASLVAGHGSSEAGLAAVRDVIKAALAKGGPDE
jgi:hypothetical protein